MRVSVRAYSAQTQLRKKGASPGNHSFKRLVGDAHDIHAIANAQRAQDASFLHFHAG